MLYVEETEEPSRNYITILVVDPAYEMTIFFNDHHTLMAVTILYYGELVEFW